MSPFASLRCFISRRRSRGNRGATSESGTHRWFAMESRPSTTTISLHAGLLSAGLFTVITDVITAPDDLTSPSATGRISTGGIAFTTTQWSVVLEAGGESPAAQEALERLCRTYWRPIYGFVRRQG